MIRSGTLAVIGAINVDMVVTTAVLPRAGETVTGGSFSMHHGGKGGNQAVAAARALGATRKPDGGPRVTLVGAVGEDDLGHAALEALASDEVGTYVAVLEDVPTGVALIAVDDAGENQISVAPGANARVGERAVLRGLEELGAGMVLASLEVPAAAVRAAGEWCIAHDVPFLVNPAPAQPWVRDLLGFASYLTPNERELRDLGDVPTGVTVVETRGSRGVRIQGAAGLLDLDVPAPHVEAVDSTGAGDTFNGVFAAGLLERLGLREAVERAVVAASLATTKPGARDGMPTRVEIDRAMEELDQPRAE